MLILDLIEMLASVIWFVVDFPKRKSRVIKFGLCRAHRKRYLLCTRASLAGRVIGLPVIIVGLFAPLRSFWQSVLVVIGLWLFLGGIFVRWGTPTLRLVSETKEFLCVEGAGEGFLKLYPAAVPSGHH